VTGEPTVHLDGEIRRLLAELTGNSAPLDAPPETALLRDGVGLDSLGGTVLLTEIEHRYGVDVAGEDLNLDSLATIGTFVAYVAAQLERR
jgi:S-adenosylmethionine decarboxylase